MGLFFSRFKRKQTINEVLEGIDKEINKLQRNRKANQDRQKQFVTSLLIYSVAAYVIAAVVFFCVCFPDTWQLRLIYSLPLLIFPILVWGLKKSLHWYFVNRISSNDTALQDLRDRKNQILEDVMETETYKKAREILEKYDPGKLRKLEGIPESVSTEMDTHGTVLQHRTLRVSEHAPMRMPVQSPPMSRSSSVMQSQNGSPYPSPPASRQGIPLSPPPSLPPPQAAAEGGYAMTARPPMPRSVLPRERGTMDRLMDYLVGDGPENRYALICWQCYSHNGMALKEEFEYLSFRCCYCYTINAARKQRPTAPRLEFFAPPGQRRPQTISDSDASSGGSDGDQDCDKSLSQSDTPEAKRMASVKSTEDAPISAPVSSSPLPDHRTTASTLEEPKQLSGIQGQQARLDVPRSENTDYNQSNSHSPDKEPRIPDPDDKGLQSDDELNRQKLQGPLDTRLRLDEPVESGANLHEAESKKLFTGGVQEIFQPSTGQDPLLNEVPTLAEQQSTDPSHPSMEPSAEESDLPEVAHIPSLRTSCEDLRTEQESDLPEVAHIPSLRTSCEDLRTEQGSDLSEVVHSPSLTTSCEDLRTEQGSDLSEVVHSPSLTTSCEDLRTEQGSDLSEVAHIQSLTTSCEDLRTDLGSNQVG